MRVPQPSRILLYLCAMGVCCDLAGEFFKIHGLEVAGVLMLFSPAYFVILVLAWALVSALARSMRRLWQ